MDQSVFNKDDFILLQNGFKESVNYIDAKINKYKLLQEEIQTILSQKQYDQNKVIGDLLMDFYINSCRENYLNSDKINKKIYQSKIKRDLAINWITYVKLSQDREDWIEDLDLYCEIQNEQIQQYNAEINKLSQDFQSMSFNATKIIKLEDQFLGLRIQDTSQQETDSKKSRKEASKLKIKNQILVQDLDENQNVDQERLILFQQQLTKIKEIKLQYNIPKNKRDYVIQEFNKYINYNEKKQEYLQQCFSMNQNNFTFKFDSNRIINNYLKFIENDTSIQTLKDNDEICKLNIRKLTATKSMVNQRLEDISSLLENEQ